MANVDKMTGVTVSPINDYQFFGRTVIAGGALSNGLMVKLDATTGRATEAADTVLPYGIILNDVQSGDPVYVLQQGVVYGFDVSALDFGAIVYGGTDGVLVDTMPQAGEPLADVGFAVGKVVPTSELGVKAVEFRF